MRARGEALAPRRIRTAALRISLCSAFVLAPARWVPVSEALACNRHTHSPDARIERPCLQNRFRLERDESAGGPEDRGPLRSELPQHSRVEELVACVDRRVPGCGPGHRLRVGDLSDARALARYAAGRTDAQTALREEQALGVRASKPIYFAVDLNETAHQARAVASYSRGVNSVLGVRRTGAYGSY